MDGATDRPVPETGLETGRLEIAGRPAPGLVSRALWIGAGSTAVAVGTIGIVVPGLPTTGFFILAAWCYARSSPRLEQWVLDLPKVGPLVRNYRAGYGMSRKNKVVAISMMWTAIAISATVTRDRPLIALGTVALGLIGTAYLLWRVPTGWGEPARSPA